MKRILFAILLGLIMLGSVVTPTNAKYVSGYYRSNGTYVNGYYRSRANAYTYDNYSYKSPSYSNGYGYNNSGRSYSSKWYTPSYGDSDYYSGLNSYNYRY